MGLLDQLWDDTVAGPRPETGLGKLRKHSSFSFRSTSGKESGNVRSFGDDSPEEAARVTRSIRIVKPPGYQNGSPPGYQNGSPPVSPAGSTPPLSPFSGEEEAERHRTGLEGGQHRMHTRKEARTSEPGLFLLITMCEL
ncbi:dormancy-associated protein homolog 3 isoform X1 [Carica papaya]|uniref:dormancy-associated protein homolog 3 isoform X1 n=1 Tax=Carica papaya TaxID=3649 RepID=UPI000B8CEF9C|nr:dormancy-associated protein homolog 3 isoform X1 [Carica papaya]